MSLSVHQWQAPDPTGAIGTYLKSLALEQARQKAEQQRAAQLGQTIAKGLLAESNQQRLRDAQDERLAFQQSEADRKDELARLKMAPKAGEVFEPLPEGGAGGGGAPAADPAGGSTGADTVLGNGGAGARLNWLANSAGNANQPAMGDQRFGLGVRNPYAAPPTPQDPIESVGEPLTDPAPVAATPAASLLESGAQFGGSPWDNSSGGAAPVATPGMPTNGAQAAGINSADNPLFDVKDDSGAKAALSPNVTRAINELGKRDPKAAKQALKEIVVSNAKAETKQETTYNGQKLNWLDDRTALVGNRVMRYDDNGQLQPVTSKHVQATYKGSDGGNYTQFSDGSWLNDTAPPEGVPISKIGTTAPKGTMEEQISSAGYSYVGKPGYENVVTNKDGTALLLASQAANGTVKYAPFKTADTIKTLKDGSIVRINPLNDSVTTIATAQAVPAKDAVNFTEALKKSAEASDKLEVLKARRNSKGAMSITNLGGVSDSELEKADNELKAAQRDAQVYQSRYPSLRAPTPAAPAVPAVAGAGAAAAPDAGTVYASEAEARAAGLKNGDLFSIKDPQTGLPRKARLR